MSPDEHLAVLRERRDWLTARIKAKASIGWDVRWDIRERDALKWAVDMLTIGPPPMRLPLPPSDF